MKILWYLTCSFESIYNLKKFEYFQNNGNIKATLHRWIRFEIKNHSLIPTTHNAFLPFFCNFNNFLKLKSNFPKFVSALSNSSFVWGHKKMSLWIFQILELCWTSRESLQKLDFSQTNKVNVSRSALIRFILFSGFVFHDRLSVLSWCALETVIQSLQRQTFGATGLRLSVYLYRRPQELIPLNPTFSSSSLSLASHGASSFLSIWDVGPSPLPLSPSAALPVIWGFFHHPQ